MPSIEHIEQMIPPYLQSYRVREIIRLCKNKETELEGLIMMREYQKDFDNKYSHLAHHFLALWKAVYEEELANEIKI